MNICLKILSFFLIHFTVQGFREGYIDNLLLFLWVQAYICVWEILDSISEKKYMQFQSLSSIAVCAASIVTLYIYAAKSTDIYSDVFFEEETVVVD